MKDMSLGLKEALRLTLENIKPLPGESVALLESIDRIAVSDLYALVDSPLSDVSLKDGYAVSCKEIAAASAENPVRLRLLGFLAAGDEKNLELKPGATIRVLTGARIPTGADTVLAEEFVKQKDQGVLIETPAEPGKNILKRGTDVTSRKCLLKSGRQITPGLAGLLAAAGHSAVPVYKNPVVGIIGTGDEIVGPGEPLSPGKLYASNIVTLAGWCRKYKMETRLKIAKDDRPALFGALKSLCAETDAVVTSGGAWTGDHDIVAHVLKELGWQEVFHRIRIGPGKAVGFGLLDQKPIFILPGGPPSNLMGFLQIALPGLLALCGHANPGLPSMNARLASELRGRDSEWTDFFFGTLEFGDGMPLFHPLENRSRLSSIAEATAVASIPEGRDSLSSGSIVSVQLIK